MDLQYKKCFSDSKYETLIVDSSYKVYMKLRIRNVTKDDFMQYKCVAKNSLGGSDGTITLYGRSWFKAGPSKPVPGNTKGGSITVVLTFCLTGLESAV
jgi:hypothetical protein